MARPATQQLHRFRDGNVVLYKRPTSNRWQARLKLPSGKWKHISTGKTTVDDAGLNACDEYDEIRFRVKNNMSAVSRRMGPICDQYTKKLQDALDSGHGKKIYVNYIRVVKNWIKPFFGDLYVDRIDHNKIAEWETWRRTTRGREFAKTTINTHNVVLRAILNHALQQNFIKEYQIPNITMKGKGIPSQRRPDFTLEEYKILRPALHHFTKKRGRNTKGVTVEIRQLLEFYVLTLIHTGMRPGIESLSLCWKDLEDFCAPSGKRYLRIWVNRGKTGERKLIAKHVVRCFLNRIKIFRDQKFTKPNDKIFVLKDGAEPKDFHGAFELLLTECDLLYDRAGKKRCLYSCRHTYATMQLVYRKLDLATLAVNMGTSTAMLERHYSHLTPTLAAERLAG